MKVELNTSLTHSQTIDSTQNNYIPISKRIFNHILKMSNEFAERQNDPSSYCEKKWSGFKENVEYQKVISNCKEFYQFERILLSSSPKD